MRAMETAHRDAVRLETERLLLRPFRNADHPSYAAMCADPEVMKYIGTGVTLTAPESWRAMASMLGHWQLLGYGMFAAEVKATGELAGRVGFLDPPGWPGFELGWLLGREHWGKGYAIEGARACLDYAFGTLGRDHVISLIRPGNERSIRVAERLGERLSGEVELLGSKALVYEVRR
ncbi:MAG TPA: GNAT family N-acetyltransferase [Usitatibacter sp.]|nr:GNAT family N-acetyltransferase [Usitatibacter sp.]